MRCILLKEILHPLPMFLLDIVFIWLWFVPSYRIVLNCGVLALLRIQLLLRLYSAELLSIFYPPLQYRTGIALSSCGYFLCFTGLTFRTCSFWSNVFCFHQITLIFFLMCHYFCKPGSRSGTSGKLFCSSHRLSSSRHFYFARVVRLWNKLPSVDLLKSYNTIKKRIYVHLWSRFVTHFNSNHFICPCSNYCNYTATAIIAVWSIKWYMHCKCIFMHLYLYHVLFENLLLLIILSEDLSWSTAKSIFYGITFFSRFMIGSLAPFTFSFLIMSQAA